MKRLRLMFLIIFFILVLGFIIIKFTNKDIDKKLIGTWSLDNNTKYEFFEKGEGQFILPSGTYKFTYKSKNDILFFDFEDDNSKDINYIYKIKNDELELKNMDSKKIKFTLKKVSRD